MRAAFTSELICSMLLEAVEVIQACKVLLEEKRKIYEIGMS
jgi:hypothetical protein